MSKITESLLNALPRYFKPKLEIDFIDLCEQKLQSIADLVSRGSLLNQRQCLDLSTKLSQTTQNIRQLVDLCGGGSAGLFRSALENLFRYLEKAKVLVSKCGEEHWWVAATYQIRNENAFREILLEVSLCYNTIYELAKSASEKSDVYPDDLRQPPAAVFAPAIASDVLEDQQDLQQRLEELDNNPSSVQLQSHPLSEEVALKAQSLARYLLLRMRYASEQSLATSLDMFCEILWRKDTEPPGTWGNSYYLGGGATEGGVCKTEWLTIPCAKKEFHVKEYMTFFLKEAGILAHLKHPCIIDFICCSNGQARGDRFIAMELMEKSLYNLIEDQEDVHFSLPMVLDIIVQIARGMCYLHDQGVAHRDLKPQNVVVNRLTYSHNTEDRFCVKLVDFGTSKTQVEVSKSNTMTARGIGTTMYRAPEVYPNANPTRKGRVAKGRAVWFKADVFSFAMTCAHVLSLKTPFQDMELPFTAEGLYNALMNGRRPSLPDKCPPELCALLKDCWNTIPRKRPSFVEICTRLETFRHIYLTDMSSKNEMTGKSLDFIKTKMEAQSSLQKVLFDRIKEDNLDEINQIDFVSIVPCTCGRALELLPQPPSSYTSWVCDICCDDWEDGDGKVYHCETCKFDTHFNCAKIKNKVSVFFHHHPLHLLIRNYYKNNPDSICRFCEESTQDCDWVYRCEECDFDVHALCTKYHSEKQYDLMHPHVLKLIQCPPHKSFLCTRCNDEIVQHTWRYSCTLQSCAIQLHPKCSTLTVASFCIFDCSHRLSLIKNRESFACGRCGALGYSWFYHCKVCDVAIHPDCVDGILDEEKANWIGAYEKFMLENGSKDDHSKTSMISELLDKLPVSDDFDSSSSISSKSPPVMTTMHPSIPKLPSTEKTSLDLQRKIAAETAERIKVKKVASMEGRQKFKTNLLEMLENLERVVVDLRSCENVSQDEVQIAATLKQLKEKQHFMKEQTAMDEQAKRSQGPRIAVFCKNVMKENGMPHWELLTKLKFKLGDWEELWNYALFCEEPGHEHIVDGKWNYVDYWDLKDLVMWDLLSDEESSADSLKDEKLQRDVLSDEESSAESSEDTKLQRDVLSDEESSAESSEDTKLQRDVLSDEESSAESSEDTKLQPLLDCGLQIVMRAMGALAPAHLTEVQSVIIPCLDAATRPWDLRALAQHEVNQNMDVLQGAADSAAEWLLRYFNYQGTNILKRFGLQRVCYKLTEEGDSPRYRRGAHAWLCTEHLNSGFKDGVLEPHPLKYYNGDDEYLIRFPNADPED